MNPELQKQLAEMLAKLTDATMSTASWAQAQAGPLVQEKIAFGRVWEPLLLVVVFAVTAALMALARHAWVKKWDNDRFAGVVLWLFATLPAVLFIAQLRGCLLVWLAPRLYVVEWLKGMVTK